MITHIPEVGDDHRFSLTQACKVLDISRPTFYRKAIANNIQKRHSRNGSRAFYLGKDIKKIWMYG